MHEGAVRHGRSGRWKDPAGAGRDGLWRMVVALASKTPKTKGRRRQVEGVHGVLPDREEVVRESVDKDAMQVRHHGREPVTKGTVKTRIDFTGEPLVE